MPNLPRKLVLSRVREINFVKKNNVTRNIEKHNTYPRYQHYVTAEGNPYGISSEGVNAIKPIILQRVGWLGLVLLDLVCPRQLRH